MVNYRKLAFDATIIQGSPRFVGLLIDWRETYASIWRFESRFLSIHLNAMENTDADIVILVLIRWKRIVDLSFSMELRSTLAALRPLTHA